ncbi:hypothetical protein [Nostoc sp.]|uniref:hypothetical protein n=1 Tax=Nostoc sp. TaxID=1180 RepID=UPI002FFCCA65
MSGEELAQLIHNLPTLALMCWKKLVNYITINQGNPKNWYDVKLDAGDRLIVLATSSSLQRIEWGEMLPRLWQLQIEKALTTNAIVYGAEKIVLITGCSSTTARQWMNNLPRVLPIPLYKHQAQRLVRELTKVQVLANLIFIGQP